MSENITFTVFILLASVHMNGVLCYCNCAPPDFGFRLDRRLLYVRNRCALLHQHLGNWHDQQNKKFVTTLKTIGHIKTNTSARGRKKGPPTSFRWVWPY